jgi:hypothetical protein
MYEDQGSERDRRRFYRIDDQVALTYQQLDERQLAAALDRLQVGHPDKLTLVSTFAATSAQMKRSLDRFRHDLPEVASYLEGLNEKLDLMVQLLAASDGGLSERPTHDVSLSAAGLSFRTDEPLEPRSILEIQLLMFPTYLCARAFGTVVRCERAQDGSGAEGYFVAVDFSHIRELDRDMIIRHITQRQSSMLREARLALEDDGWGAPEADINRGDGPPAP